ncbi:MAG TPA: phosphoglycolate phosphatase, partial [Idiomarina sp.]|nr:phosphoglycolate phosphatase [Idiomarina sp.]
MTNAVNAVLFDLDGTLLDTAPDLGAALNHVCRLHQRPQVSAEHFTPFASHGSRGLLNLVFNQDIAGDETKLPQLREQFLNYYNDNIAVHTRLFDGIENLLNALDSAGIKTAIVTNKPEALTQRLLPYFDA